MIEPVVTQNCCVLSEPCKIGRKKQSVTPPPTTELLIVRSGKVAGRHKQERTSIPLRFGGFWVMEHGT
jgi:hypothetical protein